MKQAHYSLLRHISAAFFLFSILPVAFAQDFDTSKPIPPPETMQAMLWQTGELQDVKLEGLLHTQKSKHSIILRTKGRVMQYEFLETPLQIRVEITSAGSVIQKRENSSQKWQELSSQQRLGRIVDSDVFYEDLGIDFIRWENVKPLGRDSILTFDTWVYESRPSGPSNYAKARFWISSKFQALLRVDAYDKNDKVIKRVEVNGVMKIDDLFSIKEMVIKTMIPDRDVSSSRTFIEIRKGSKGSGL